MAPASGGLRILGIDPGLRITGFGIIEKTGQRLSYITSGCIRTRETESLPQRLRTILDNLGQVIEDGQPQQVAVEKVFVNVNPQSTLLLGQARGAAICAAVTRSLPVAEYTALQMKKAVAGYGKAAKAEVQEMVRRLLRLNATPGTDAADALGLAIAHAHLGPARERIAQVTPLARKSSAMYRRGRNY